MAAGKRATLKEPTRSCRCPGSRGSGPCTAVRWSKVTLVLNNDDVRAYNEHARTRYRRDDA